MASVSWLRPHYDQQQWPGERDPTWVAPAEVPPIDPSMVLEKIDAALADSADYPLMANSVAPLIDQNGQCTPEARTQANQAMDVLTEQGVLFRDPRGVEIGGDVLPLWHRVSELPE